MDAAEDLETLAARFRDIGPLEFYSSPLYRTLVTAVADRPDLLSLVSRRRPGQQPTIVFLAAVHYLVLGDAGAGHPLRDFYVSVVGEDAVRPADEATGPFLDFCTQHVDEIGALVSTRLVQTNVVKRSAALRLGLASLPDAPETVHLVEIGASAGIHLLNDRYRFVVGGQTFGDPTSAVEIPVEWRSGVPPPDLDRVPAIGTRIGVDLNPLDATSADDRRWLRALIWPENVGQAVIQDAALAVVAADPPEVVAGDIAAGIAGEIDERLRRGDARVVMHSVVRAHVGADRVAAFDAGVASLGEHGPLWVMSLEAPEWDDPKPSELKPHHALKVRGPDGDTRTVALVDAHGEWLEPV